MKKAKKFLALLTAMVMTLAAAVPAMAAGETYTIKITAPDAANDHEFAAYQIFAGTLSSENTLTDVEWGAGIDENKLSYLYAALKEVADTNNSKPFSSMTQESAASVSDILAENSDDTTLIQAFQELITEKENDSYKYLSSTSTAIEHAGDAEDGIYTAADVAAGYYVIVDGKDVNAASFMLKVVGNVDVTAKMSVPSVTKYAGEETVTDNAKFSVGDEIPYTLVGTTPNFSAEGYTYKFTDTMDDALDLVYTASQSNPSQVEGGVKVTIGNEENAVDITEKFLITYENHVLTIESNQDLKDSGLSADSEIYVTYTATVNSGITSGTGVENTVVVESQMNTDSATKTPEIKEQVYPITMIITKVDGEDDSKMLEGAKFQLYRKDADGTITGYATVTASGEFAGWTGNEKDAAELTTNAEGKITLVGIGAGEFYLKETEAPAGYNKLTDEVKIIIQSESETSATGTVQLKLLKYSLNDGQLTTEGVTLENGTIAFNIENNQGATLPSTGGIGTTIFYVIGGILVVGAAVVLIVRRRMSAEK